MSEYSYKDSGINWLGEIPKHWETDRLKDKTLRVVGGDWGDDPDSDKEGNIVPVIRVADIEDLTFNLNDLTLRKISDTSLKSRLINKSCLLIEKSGGGEKQKVGRLAYPQDLETNAICSNFMALVEFDKTVDLRFINYVFHDLYNSDVNYQFIQQTTGIQNLKIEYYLCTKVGFPPPEEQKAIADYLEKAYAKIDRVLELKRRQFIQIDEFFKSRMFEILKGTDISDIEFSTSEFEWISKIPTTWEVFRLKHISSKINSGVTPKGGADVYVDEGVPMVRSQNITFERLDIENAVKIPEEVHNSMSNSKLRRGDVLLNITGASLGRCNFFEYDIEANVNQHVCIIRPRFQILTKFLFYLLNSEIGQAQIFSGFKGSGREGLNFEAIKNFRLPVPDTKSQEKIIERLDKIADSVKKQKKLINLQVTRLTNYRASLIHECITGKKKVFEGEPDSLKAEVV